MRLLPHIRARAGAPLLAALLGAAPLAGQATSAPPADTTRARAAQPLDAVRVASRTRAGGVAAAEPRSTEVIDRAAIARTAARTLSDVLALAVGADVLARSPAQADVALRGGSYEQVLVLVDGVRVKDVQSGHFSLDLAVPLDAVERVEVLRGAGSAVYGPDAMGGVVNVVTRGDAGWRVARLRGGAFGTAGGAVAGGEGLGALTVTGAAEHERSDGHRAGTDYRVTQARLGARAAGRLGALAADAALATRAFGAADFYAAFPSFETTRTATASLRWDAPAAGAWRVAGSVASRRHADDYVLRRAEPAFYRNRHVGWQTSGDVLARWTRGARALAVGAEAMDARLASARLGDRRELRSAVFAEGTVGRAGAATVNGGIRYDRAPSYGGFVSPTLAASVPVRGLWLRGSVARGFRAPTWTERFYEDPANVGSPTLRAETSWSGEAGVRALPAWGSGGARVDVAGFVRRAEDLIDWARAVDAPAGTPWRTQNVESARYRGVEARVDLPALLGASWTARASALALDASAADGLSGKYALRPLTRTAGVSVTVPAGERVRLALDATGARRAGERAYVVANARATARWRGFLLTLDALNLGGSRWLDASGKPSPARAVYLGAGWTGGA